MEAEDWDARYAAGPDLQWGAEPNRWLAREAETLPPGTALDLGAGEGRNAVWLAGRGWRVTAVDFSQVGLATGRRLADEAATAGRELAIDWVVADVRTYRPTPGGYDLVLLVYLHLPGEQRREVIRTAASGLAPGGTLLVIGHDRTNPTEGYGGPPDPAVLFTADDVLTDLAGEREAGLLRVERAERVDRPVETPDGPRVARDALARLRRPA